MKIGHTTPLAAQKLINKLGGIFHAYEHAKEMRVREPWNSHWDKMVRYLASIINEKTNK